MFLVEIEKRSPVTVKIDANSETGVKYFKFFKKFSAIMGMSRRTK